MTVTVTTTTTTNDGMDRDCVLGGVEWCRLPRVLWSRRGLWRLGPPATALGCSTNVGQFVFGFLLLAERFVH